MARYRKKPVEIEAEQYFSGRTTKGVHFDSAGPFVITIHGQRTDIVEGDWIIREPDNVHYYPCKPDIFEASYERLTELRDIK